VALLTDVDVRGVDPCVCVNLKHVPGAVSGKHNNRNKEKEGKKEMKRQDRRQILQYLDL
jgi:hypothetical protein